MGLLSRLRRRQPVALPPLESREASSSLWGRARKLRSRTLNAVEKRTGWDIDGDGDVGELGGEAEGTLLSRAVNAVEKRTGWDIDGDGDVGELGGEAEGTLLSRAVNAVEKRTGWDIDGDGDVGELGGEAEGTLLSRAVNAVEKRTGWDIDGDGDVGELGGEAEGTLLSRAVNAVEKRTGWDIDGDGDVGELGGEAEGTLLSRAVNAVERRLDLDLDGDGDIGVLGVLGPEPEPQYTVHEFYVAATNAISSTTEAGVLLAVCDAVERAGLQSLYYQAATGRRSEKGVLLAMCDAVEALWVPLGEPEPEPELEPEPGLELEPEPEPEPTLAELRKMRLPQLVKHALQRELMTKSQLDELMRTEEDPGMVLVALLTPPAQVMTEAGTLVLGEMVSVLRSGIAIEAEAVDLQFSEKGLRIKFIFPETDRWAEWDEQWPVECIKGPEVTLLHRLPLNHHSTSKFRDAQIKKARAKSKSKSQVVQLVTDTLRECFLKQGVDLGQAFRFFDKDGSGDITAAEIAAGLEAMHVSIPEERLEHMMLAIDIDGDGSIDLGEFFRHFGDGRAGAEGQFVPAPAGWEGAKPGYCFRVGEHGLGYYLDIGLKNRLLMEGGKLKGPPSPVWIGAARQARQDAALRAAEQSEFESENGGGAGGGSVVAGRDPVLRTLRAEPSIEARHERLASLLHTPKPAVATAAANLQANRKGGVFGSRSARQASYLKETRARGTLDEQAARRRRVEAAVMARDESMARDLAVDPRERWKDQATGSKLSSLKALQKEEERDRALRAEEEAIRRRMLVGGLTVQQGDTLRARLEFIRRQLGQAQRLVRINGEAIDMNASYVWGSREGIIQEQRRKAELQQVETKLLTPGKTHGGIVRPPPPSTGSPLRPMNLSWEWGQHPGFTAQRARPLPLLEVTYTKEIELDGEPQLQSVLRDTGAGAGGIGAGGGERQKQRRLRLAPTVYDLQECATLIPQIGPHTKQGQGNGGFTQGWRSY